MGFLEDCKKHFGTSNLYELFSLPPAPNSVTASQVKKAYYSKSLLYHPDKNAEPGAGSSSTKDKPNHSTECFQILSRAYSILSDKEKRAVYDETGIIDDENVVSDEGQDWISYWRLLFKKVTVDDIEDFRSRYKDSPSETEDLVKYYERFEGNMVQILECMPLAETEEDQLRFADILDGLVESGELEAYPAHAKTSRKVKTKKQKRKAEDEARLADAAKKKLMDKNSTSDLEKAIVANKSRRMDTSDSFLDKLAEKYANPSPKSGKASKKTKKK